ncbi:putative snRNA-activating protein complex subunit 2 [Scophthalmus maximus]|uniref:Putative snRNA-activating protein complex subunit 2 n=1 Tax=Scophthalmus maximus TaxID=52904 RepID=A0A2U9AW28_SCOMX|nr:putative snRNA-activating protein complex subunit 2 [Scophthalmus maximus]
MKPPPRTRTKPSRRLEPDVAPRASRKLSVDWPPVEQRKLLNALRSLGRTLDGCGDVDYAFLSKQVPTRSVSEIHSVVESLKNKVISCAKVKLKKNRLEDKKVKKPIEVWTHMASALAGSLEESISSAFYQILTVSSTEPCTLRNCDPPKVHRPPTGADRPVGRTVSLRPMPRLPVKASSSCSSSRPMPPLSTHAAEFHTSFGCTSKVTSKDSPITFGVKCIVDFERIYRYLSVIHKPDEECHLTPMESAIMLDLLMSLPEEMPLLDCTKLQKHLTQVYQCLSSPANSKMAREMFKDLKDGPTAQGDVRSGGDGNTPDGQQNTARTVDSSGVVDSEEPDVAESRSSRSKNASTQSGKADVIGPCPPLNPFLVPLKLLVRR